MTVLIVFCLSGCAALESRELFVTCRAADTATTIKIVQLGGVETNPLLKNIVMGHHWLIFVAIESGISWLAWHYWDDLKPEGQLLANAVSCSPIPNNIHVIRAQKAINEAP